jgi:hypothetical protein
MQHHLIWQCRAEIELSAVSLIELHVKNKVNRIIPLLLMDDNTLLSFFSLFQPFSLSLTVPLASSKEDASLCDIRLPNMKFFSIMLL